MILLYLKKNKKLCAVRRSHSYQGENSFETLRIISADEISGHSLADCTIECHIINPYKEGDIVQLSFSGEIPTSDILLGNKYTAINGELIVFLKIFCDGNVIGLTNEVTVKIREHKAVSSYISDSQLTLLDQYSITFQKAAQIVEQGVDEEKFKEYVTDYFNTHDVAYEITPEEAWEIFEEE